MASESSAERIARTVAYYEALDRKHQIEAEQHNAAVGYDGLRAASAAEWDDTYHLFKHPTPNQTI